MLLYLENLWSLFVDMSYYIVIGLIFTGLLHVFIKKDAILKHIGKNTTSSVVKASVLGVPLPLCSCGVVPTAMYLGKSGASKGAVVSFLTSTPQTGIDSITATYGMMGGLFAVYRAITAFISGIISGVFTNIFCKNNKINYDVKSSSCCSSEKEEVKTHSCCCSSKKEEVKTHSCCCSSKKEEVKTHNCCCSSKKEEVKKHSCCCSSKKEEVQAVSSCCSSKKNEETEKICSCSQEHKDSQSKHESFGSKLKRAFTYAFGEFLDEIAFHFVVGLLIAALISTLLPTTIFSNFNNPIVVMILMVVIGIPMYICSTASIPIAVSLMMKGISPGAAFVFLFAGPVTNIASITIILKTLGKKVTIIYLTSAAFCAIGFGLILDYIIKLTNYSGISNIVNHCHTHKTPIHMTIIAIVFGVLVLKSLWKNFSKKSSCGCGQVH